LLMIENAGPERAGNRFGRPFDERLPHWHCHRQCTSLLPLRSVTGATPAYFALSPHR
jgi:hypothetical protein